MTSKGVKPRPKPEQPPRPAPVPPRLAPPRPRSRPRYVLEEAKRLKLELMPHQVLVATYLEAQVRGRWRYPEVADVLARQNGKTTLLVPLIVSRLARGFRIMHSAQNRSLPREVFLEVADAMETHHYAELAGRPRLANGQEVIRTKAGGVYRVVAPTSGGARGNPNDLVITDELREFTDWAYVGAARGTLAASSNPQALYLSNAGDEASVVLNALRARAETDDRLAFIEWSARPERPPDDREGWREANPAMGWTVTEEYLEAQYQAYQAEGQVSIFEVEHLCRWVSAVGKSVVSAVAWDRGRASALEPIRRPVLGIAATATRASAVLAWMQTDGSVAITLAADVTGSPVDIEAVGRALKRYATANRVVGVARGQGDRDLARFLDNVKGLNLAEAAAASVRFAATVESGRLRHAGADVVGLDLPYITRKEAGGTWTAEPVARPGRWPTAALAAIRAVYLATEPRSKPGVF